MSRLRPTRALSRRSSRCGSKGFQVIASHSIKRTERQESPYAHTHTHTQEHDCRAVKGLSYSLWHRIALVQAS